MTRTLVDYDDLYRWLVSCAEDGGEVPTNDAICGRYNLVSSSNGSAAIAYLERQGLIKVERFKHARRIVITATGKATRPVPMALAVHRAPPQDLMEQTAPVESKERHRHWSSAMRPLMNRAIVVGPSSTCRWIEEPDHAAMLKRASNGDETLYCGQHSVPGRSWCPEHAERTYVERKVAAE